MIDDYSKFVSELEGHFDDIIKKVAPIGIRLSARLNNNQDDVLIILFHDVLKRLISNIEVLKKIKISEATCVAYRLILRATTADLIECFYLFMISPEKRKDEIWKKNLEAVRTIKLFAKEKKYFFEELNEESMSDIDISVLHTLYSDYFDIENNDFFSKNKYSKLSTGSMIPKLEKDGLCSHEFNQLYTNYRLLSLTEHYSIVGRRYSYNQHLDHLFTIDVVRWIALGTDVICQATQEYLDTGKITLDKVS